MASSSFRLNHKGGEEVLKEMIRATINGLGQQVTDQAGPDAQVDFHTTDRAVASVSVPAGQQAKDGRLTKAASAAGLEVRAK